MSPWYPMIPLRSYVGIMLCFILNIHSWSGDHVCAYAYAYTHSLRVPCQHSRHLKTGVSLTSRSSKSLTSLGMYSDSQITQLQTHSNFFTPKLSANFQNSLTLPSMDTFFKPTTSILAIVPALLTTALQTLYPLDLIQYIIFQVTYKQFFVFCHKLQTMFAKLLHLGDPREYDKSIAGFFAEKSKYLAKLMGINYVVKVNVYMY